MHAVALLAAERAETATYHAPDLPPPYCPPFTPMVGVIPEGERDGWLVEHFEIDHATAAYENAMAGLRRRGAERIVAGSYCRLYRPGSLDITMSDTPMERRTNMDLIRHAHGDVLITGLGIGMVLLPLIAKPQVRTVCVLEKSPAVIDLVAPHIAARDPNGKVTVVQGDAFDGLPAQYRARRFETVYHDIWPTISADNWEQMKVLHRRYRKHLAPGGWMESWRREYCRYLSR